MKYSKMHCQQCSICFCEDIQQNFITLDLCHHSFCKDCFTEYINTEISSFNLLKIKCPEHTCSHTLNSKTLQASLDPLTYEKYQSLLLKKRNSQSQAKICPKPGCSRLFLPFENATHTVCGCGASICNSCGLLNHEGKSCVAAIDPEFEVYVSKNDVKFCVMCKTVISRTEGCVHMTCPICDYEWCWLCGREHSQEHPQYCPRKWDPLPPAVIVKETKKKDTRPRFQRFLTWLKAFLKFFILSELFWPYLIFNVPSEIRSVDNTLSNKVQIFVMASIIEVIYMAPMLFFVVRMFITPEHIPIILACMTMIGSMPWFIKIFCVYCFDDSPLDGAQNPKRWQSRNAQEFSFKSANKQDPGRQNEAPIIENNQDHMTIYIEPSYMGQSQMPFNKFPIDFEAEQYDFIECQEPNLSIFKLEGLMPL